MIYLFVFFISIFFLYLFERRQNRRNRFFFLFLAAIGPILLAGLRADSVGMDIEYVSRPMKWAKGASDINVFLKYFDGEFLFYSFIYLFTKLFNSQAIVLFTIHLIIISNWLFFLFQSKKIFNISICFGYAIALFYLYNQSLTVMRQSIAVSLTLSSLIFLIKKKYIKFVILTIASTMLHTSSIIVAIPILFFYCFFNESQHIINEKKKVVFGLIFFSAAFIPATTYISFFSVYFDQKYSDRIVQYGSNSGGVLTLIFVACISVVPLIICYKKRICLEPFMYLPLFSFFFQFAGRNAIYLTRLSLPFSAIFMLSLPYSIRNRSHQLAVVSIFVLYWMIAIYIRNDWQTIPYVMIDFD